MRPSGDSPDLVNDALSQLGKALRFIGSHLLLFFSSLAVAALVCATGSATPGLVSPSLFALFISAFFGFFLLLPARRPEQPQDIVPLVTGLSLCFAWTLYGLPWQYTPIWGATAAFFTKVLASRGRLGLAWSALPFLLAGLFSYYSGIEGSARLATPFWSLPLFALAGWLCLEFIRITAKRLRAARNKGKEPDFALARKLDAYRQSALRLSAGGQSLPSGVRATVCRISEGAQKIVQSMADDPADVSAGDRFLSRYLTAAHTVVADYLRLAQVSPGNQDIVDALVRAERTLAALDRAFAEEYVRLLRNDTMSFRAELAALDTLLTMDGRGL